VRAVAGFLQLNAQVLFWTFVAPFVGYPRMKFGPLAGQMVKIGVQAVPMAALTAFSIGLTLAMQGAQELSRMGASSYVPDLISMSLLRELGPLIVGVVVIGRSGSAITAELGTMKVSEEIEALEVMAIDPVRYLVCPRFWALIIMLPVLTVLGIYVGFVGGWSICHFSLGMDTNAYIHRLISSAGPHDLWAGMTKSLVFGWLIAGIACRRGLDVRGGAEGVGLSTTSSVVVSIILMLVANALLTALFFLFEQ
jgi:phospholipid/cholesterol/gamma-HCH transport system permease protein